MKGNKTNGQRRWKLGLVTIPIAALMALMLWSQAGATGNSLTSPDTMGNVGGNPSIVLDPTGNPRVTHYDYDNYDLRVTFCQDPNCTLSNTISPDPGGDTGSSSSVRLDAAGRPVVVYNYDTDYDLRVLHCGNTTCSSGNSIASPDTAGNVGGNPSMVLDAAGNPVATYYDYDNMDLKVLHCGNPNCTSGNSITSPDTGGNTGKTSSVALDAAGNPVVAYDYDDAGDLRVLHCGNPNCTSGNSIASPDTANDVGNDPSLALNGSGYPVVAHYDYDNGDLRVTFCGNPNCTSGNSTVAPDTAGNVGGEPSMVLDGAFRPVTTHYDYDNDDLRVTFCGNPNCTSGNTTVAPDTAGNVGGSPSLALDPAFRPVTTHYDYDNDDLRVLHCADPNCTGVKAAATSTPPTNTPVPTPTIGPPSLGGVASYPSPSSGNHADVIAIGGATAAAMLLALAFALRRRVRAAGRGVAASFGRGGKSSI